MNGPLKPKPAATVSLTLGNGQVIQLTDPSLDSQPKVQFVAQFDPSMGHIFSSPTTQVTQVTQMVTPRTLDEDVVPANHGFQNEFLEDLARSQVTNFLFAHLFGIEIILYAIIFSLFTFYSLLN